MPWSPQEPPRTQGRGILMKLLQPNNAADNARSGWGE